MAQPQHTGVFTRWFEQFAEALNYGGLSLAHRALIVLEATRPMSNVRQLNHTYPLLGDLLEGRAQFPNSRRPRRTPLPGSPRSASAGSLPDLLVLERQRHVSAAELAVRLG
jgi:hypothetical protein